MYVVVYKGESINVIIHQIHNHTWSAYGRWLKMALVLSFGFLFVTVLLARLVLVPIQPSSCRLFNYLVRLLNKAIIWSIT